MLKYDYFNALETLCEVALDAVSAATRATPARPSAIYEIAQRCYDISGDIERALFSDFLPPLDRESLISYAHSLTSLADTALIYSALSPVSRGLSHTAKLERICHDLSALISQSTALLKNIKKSPDIPSIEGFKKLKTDALELALSLSNGRASTLAPKPTEAETRLILALSDTFDILIETMLKNI